MRFAALPIVWGYPRLHEVRSNLTTKRTARVFFTISGQGMVLLRGFIKKDQETIPQKELKLAHRRMKEQEQHGQNKPARRFDA